MKRLIRFAVLCIPLLPLAASAQSVTDPVVKPPAAVSASNSIPGAVSIPTNAPPITASGSVFSMNYLTQIIAAVRQSTTVNAGYGYSDKKFGTVMEEQLTLASVSNSTFAMEFGLGYCDKFSGNATEQYLGVSVSDQIFKLPFKLSLPLNVANPSSLNTFQVYGFAFIGARVESISSMHYEQNDFLAAAGGGFHF